MSAVDLAAARRIADQQQALTGTCGRVFGSRSRTGHPCGRSAGHDFADPYGHVCRCEAEKYLETHVGPCAPTRFEATA